MLLLLLIFAVKGIVSGQIISNGELILWTDATGNIQIPTTVTSIRDSVFFNNKNITSVFIPSSVTKVGKGAFLGCSSIVSVTIGQADSLAMNGIYIAPTAFSGCVAISSITLNNNVSTLDANNSPFKNMISLTDVIIGDGTSMMPENLFLNCFELKTVRVGLTNALKTTVNIPSTVFTGCAKLQSAVFNKNFMVVGATSPFTDVTTISFGNAVTFLSNNSFSNCNKIVSVDLPVSVVQLFPGAFQYCTQLKSINFQGVRVVGQNAFYGCTSLESINIPNAVKTIEGATFYNCIKLSAIEVGSSVTDIRSSAFYGCAALQSITLPNTMKVIGEKVFMECTNLQIVQLGNTLTSIGAYAFSGCSKLETIPLPLTINQIGSFSFENCLSLKSLSIPGNTQNIGESAYKGCKGLLSVTIGETDNPGTPLTFGNFAFLDCTGINSLILNKNIVDDPYYSPFMGLTSLKNAVVNNRVTQLNTFAFYGCTMLESISISNSVSYIAAAAFQGCTSLTEVKLPKNLNFLSSQLFYGCTNLTTVNIPINVKSLGSYVFYKCEKLSKVNLPAGVEFIGPIAFNGCTGLLEFNSANPVPPATGSSCFTGIPVATSTLFIPFDSKSKYMAESQWSVFANIVEKDIALDTTHSGDTITIFPESIIGVVKNINITAGNLSLALTPQELNTVNKLTISGSINASDFLVMRDQMPQLNVIDLSNVVVESYSGWNGTAGYGSYSANTIPVSAFENKTRLYSIKLPNSISSIADKAFKLCGNIQQELQLPAELKSIGKEAFYGCQSIYGTVVIPSKITSLGERAFERCKKIIQIKLLAELNAIEYSTFSGCEYLMKIDMPTSVTTLKGSVFYECGRLFVVNIPSLKVISDNVFAKCNGLRSFTLPPMLETLGDYAFAGCSSLKEVVIPPSITKLGTGIFYDCLSLATVHLPATLTTLSDGVFANCSRISSIYVYAVNPPVFLYPGGSFNSLVYSRCVLYVPKGTLETYYQVGDWNMFSNIVEMPATGLTRNFISDIRIYPNPVTDNLVVTGLQNPALLSVFDLSGVCLLSISVENNQTLSLYHLTTGTYIIRLKTVDGLFEKIIIKK